MQVLFLVLNRTEYLETLLERLLESGIHGCTVLDSMGMMRVIDKSGDDLPMFGALRQLFDPARESSKTLMMVLAEDEVHTAKLVLLVVILWVTNPVSSHLIARMELITGRDREPDRLTGEGEEEL